MSKWQTTVLDILSAAGVVAGAFAPTFDAWMGHHPFVSAAGVAVFAIIHRVAPKWGS